MTDERQDVLIGQKRRSDSYGLVEIESRGGCVRRRGIGLEYRLSCRVRAPAGRHVDVRRPLRPQPADQLPAAA